MLFLFLGKKKREESASFLWPPAGQNAGIALDIDTEFRNEK